MTKNDYIWEYSCSNSPKNGFLKQNLYDDPIKVLECLDIVFLGQFDVPEHVFNIFLMIGPLLMVSWLL